MVDFRFVAPDLRKLDELGAEVIACSVFRDERPLRGLAGLLDWRLAARLSKLAKEEFLSGDAGEVLVAPVRPRLPFDKVLLAGLGPRASFDDATFRMVAAKILDALSGLHVKRAVIELPGRASDAITPERAAELFLEIATDEQTDALVLVEDGESARRMEKHAKERRLRLARATPEP